jgi:hypothetical protein
MAGIVYPFAVSYGLGFGVPVGLLSGGIALAARRTVPYRFSLPFLVGVPTIGAGYARFNVPEPVENGAEWAMWMGVLHGSFCGYAGAFSIVSGAPWMIAAGKRSGDRAREEGPSSTCGARYWPAKTLARATPRAWAAAAAGQDRCAAVAAAHRPASDKRIATAQCPVLFFPFLSGRPYRQKGHEAIKSFI